MSHSIPKHKSDGPESASKKLKMSSMGTSEGSIKASGFEYGYVRWGHADAEKKVLCLHGWMDNANTMKFVGEELAKEGYDVVSLDMPGHGKSQHYPVYNPYSVTGYVVGVADVVEELGWGSFDMVGHSLGGGVGLVAAGVFGDKCKSFVAIDAVGGRTQDVKEKVIEQMRAAIKQNRSLATETGRLFPSFDAAVDARAKSNVIGLKISREAAEALAERGVVSEKGPDGTVGYRFGHDRRLQSRSPLYLTEAQLEAFMESVTARTLFVRAESGVPYPPKVIDRRVAKVKGAKLVTVPGDHHLHLDPETAPGVAKLIANFVTGRPGEATASVGGGGGGSVGAIEESKE